ncbi:MAG: polyprenyl synthetase family protein [Acidobacteria bacterium]|nr:polyprenyl synthetase family protein [Acidobacteriota bacterium]
MGSGNIGQPLTTREIFDLVHADLDRVEQQINVQLTASVDAITNIGKYLQAGGGKRLRPILLLLSAHLVAPVSDSAIRLAGVVEMIHAATLVHDDVIDIAQTRRGRPSPNVVWGNHTSVLAGDWLYMQAFQIAQRERDFDILGILISLTQMMVEGELLQLERLGRINISEVDYLDMVDRKTASLFSACARLGAMAGGAEPGLVARLGEFAWNLGMAFQLVDDILDFTATTEVLGKPVGNDLREGKVTLPLIYALNEASEAERGLAETVLEDGNYERVPFVAVREMIENRGGFVQAQQRAAIFTGKARKLMGLFPDSPYQRALLAVTELVTDRDH